MRIAYLTAVLFLAPTWASAADPITAPRAKAKAEAAAALALAASCDCPANDVKCGRVAEVLARVSAEIALENARPVVAPLPREKAKTCDCAGGACLDCEACACPKAAAPARPPALPAAFVDAGGCTWTPVRLADGSVGYARSCPSRR